jgi:hypothetical protein
MQWAFGLDDPAEHRSRSIAEPDARMVLVSARLPWHFPAMHAFGVRMRKSQGWLQTRIQVKQNSCQCNYRSVSRHVLRHRSIYALVGVPETFQ